MPPFMSHYKWAVARVTRLFDQHEQAPAHGRVVARKWDQADQLFVEVWRASPHWRWRIMAFHERGGWRHKKSGSAPDGKKAKAAAMRAVKPLIRERIEKYNRLDGLA